MEASIYWDHDEGAFEFARDYKSSPSGNLRNVAGLAVLKTGFLSMLKSSPSYKGHFDYEKCSTDDNAYHGNLLFKYGSKKTLRNAVSAVLAFNASLLP
jgi:hypothetical protein